MNIHPRFLIVSIVASTLASSALAQPTIPWSTTDCGGGQLSGGTYSLNATIAQPDAATPIAGGTFTLTGGFWPGINTCPADFNGDGALTVQDIFDFLAAWFAGNPAANFNGAAGIGVQDIFDFLTAWFSGC